MIIYKRLDLRFTRISKIESGKVFKGGNLYLNRKNFERIGITSVFYKTVTL